MMQEPVQQSRSTNPSAMPSVPVQEAGAEVNKPRPVVVALIGIPGSGKNAVAQAMAAHLRLRRVNRDLIRAAMFPQCSYSFAEKRAAFRALLLTLEINCLLGESSVVDGMTFSRRRDLERVDKAIRSYGFLPIPVFLDCSLDTARKRIAEQIADQPTLARDLSPDLAAAVRARFDTPPPNALVINANLPLDEVARIAIAAVARMRD
jgi:predicted kinase